MNTVIRYAFAFAILSLGSFAHSQTPAPDLILVNGKIFTSNTNQLYVQALAIRGERIEAVGASEEIKRLASNTTQIIDLGGRTVIPGINDAHNHLEIIPPNHIDLELKSPDPAWPEMKAAIIAAVQKAPKGTFIFGEMAWKIFRDPSVNRDTLDQVAPNNPLILQTLSNHAWIMNSAALARAGIRDGQPDPDGGRYEKSPDSRLTGVIREYAVFDIERTFAEQTSEADALTELRKTLSAAARWGITTIQDMSNSMPPDRAVALLEKMPTPIRVRVMRMPVTTPSGRDIQEGRPVPHSSNPLITVSGSKWMLDGTPLEGTFAPRNDPATVEYFVLHEQLTFPKTELAAMLQESLHDHDQLLLHVSSYPPAVAMLNAMQSAGGAQVWAKQRVRFEHGDGLTPDLIPRVKEMGIVVVENPTHLALANFNPDLHDVFIKTETQPLRSLLAAGIPLALGSDGPTNPYLNIMLASLHPNRPSEAITREQAVIAYTLTSAYAEFAEKDKGSLELGKLADLAVLSQDIFTVPASELPKTTSLLTVVGGKVVYDASMMEPKTRDNAQDAFSGIWKLDAAKYPVGLGAIATYTLSADGKEHYSNNRSREYDFAIDGKEYPTDRPGTTVAWTKTGQSTWTCVERIQGKPIREIHLILASDGQTLKTTYSWFNPGNRTAQGATMFNRISGGPGLEGSWKVVKRVEEPDLFYIAFPAPGQLYIHIDPMDYTWAGPLDGTFRPVQCPQLAPGTASAFKLTQPRRMDIQTKIDDKLSHLEKWEISEDGKTLTRTIWPPGQQNNTAVVILEKQ